MEREYTLIIQKQKSVLSEALSISKDDDGVSVYLRLLGSPFFDISKHNYTYSKISITDKYKVIKENAITPIVDNRILFKINNELTNVLEIGEYQLYIRLIDDRGQYYTLPPIKMECIKSNELSTLTLDEGTIEKGNVDNVSIQSLGEDIPSYLTDGSYNRTIWQTNDLITGNKMNKIESVLNDEVDNSIQFVQALELLNKEKGYNLKEGTSVNPINIYNLPVGNYILNGYIKDLSNSTVQEVENARYYVVYKDEDCSYILRNLSTDKIPILLKYDSYHNQVLAVTGQIKTLKTVSDTLQLTNDEFQFLSIGDLVKLKLPKNIDFTRIHLFILPTSDLTITFPKISWENYPLLKQDMFTEITLTCYNNVWYGKAHTFEKSTTTTATYSEETTFNANSVGCDFDYDDYKDIIKNTVGEEYIKNE